MIGCFFTLTDCLGVSPFRRESRFPGCGFSLSPAQAFFSFISGEGAEQTLLPSGIEDKCSPYTALLAHLKNIRDSFRQGWHSSARAINRITAALSMYCLLCT